MPFYFYFLAQFFLSVIRMLLGLKTEKSLPHKFWGILSGNKALLDLMFRKAGCFKLYKVFKNPLLYCAYTFALNLILPFGGSNHKVSFQKYKDYC